MPVRENDVIPGVGTVNSLQNVLTNGQGQALTILDTDAPVSTDFVILRDGAVVLREGDPVAAPPGAVLSSLQNAHWESDDLGNLVFTAHLAGPGINTQNDSVLYWNDRLLAQERTAVGAPQVHADTIWRYFLAFKLDGANRILVWAELDEPTLPGPLNDALVRIELDDDGNLLATDVVAIEGQSLPGPPFLFDRFSNATSPHFGAFNANGDFLWTPVNTDGDAEMRIGLDQVVGFEGLQFVDPGDPQVDGRTILNFHLAEVDLNDFGDFVYTALLDGDVDSNHILVRNGQKFVQEGDVLPSLNGASIFGLTAAPLVLANSGDLFWVADLLALASENRAYMRNEEVILRKGISTIGPDLIVDVRATAEAFRVSRNGRFLLGEVVLAGGIEAAVRIDYGSVVPVLGADKNVGTLARIDGEALPGDTLVLEADGGQTLGVTTFFFLSGQPAALPTPFGELLVGVPFAHVQVGPIWLGNPVSFGVPVPTNLGLVDSVWFSQAAFVDVAGVLFGPDVQLTNGLRIEVGAP